MITVGISEYGICTAPDKIMTVALGSCVGVVLYSKLSNTCGLIHVMMPKATGETENLCKYADTGIRKVVDELSLRGVMRASLRAKICGGAEMFELSHKISHLSIGERNIIAVKDMLHELKIGISAEDLGGTRSRTIIFDPKTKLLEIKVPGQKSYFI